MLDPKYARGRQRRLLEVIERQKLDAAVIGLSPHVYYFTAHLPFWLHHVALVLTADGRSLLVAANKESPGAAADEVETYEATWNGTQRQEQPALVASAVLAALTDGHCRRIAIDTSAVTALIAAAFDGATTPIDSDLWQLRRRKDPDA